MNTNASADAPGPIRLGEPHALAILDSALDAVITIDHLGRILEFNLAAEWTFGYPREEVLGRELAEVRCAVLYEKSRSLVACEYVWKRTDLWIDFPWSAEPPLATATKVTADAASGRG